LAVGIVIHARLTRKLTSRTAAAGALLCAIVAGPWYIRNIALYGNLGGLQEARGGTSLSGLLTASLRLPWLRSLQGLMYGGLWTGNNSFTSFSSITLTLFIIAVLVSVVLLGRRLLRDETTPGERAVSLGCALYILALLYSTVLSHWHSKGVVITTGQWYSQPLVPVLWCLLFSVLARSGRVGRITANALVALSAYIICLTYFGKLIPLYAGYGNGRAVLSELFALYGKNREGLVENLSTAAIGDPGIILALSLVVTAAAAAFAPMLLIREKAAHPWTGRAA
jgi:hypothetical protein